jgi:3-oxoadipate enol-lactonase
MTATAMRNGTRWVNANDTVSRVALSGAGDTLLVLIHEMGGTLESWDLVVEQLGQRRHILRYDVRGAGLSQKVRGTLSIEVLAADLAAILDAVGAPERIALLGTAVGGAIALRFAADFAGRTAAVIATSTSSNATVSSPASTSGCCARIRRCSGPIPSGSSR